MIQKSNIVLCTVILAWVSLAIIILLSPNKFILDEYIYYKNLYSNYPPFSVEFIRNYQGTAGIVSTWVHILILNITDGDIVKMRITNLFWVFLTALLFSKSYKTEDNGSGKLLGFALILSPYMFDMTARVMGEFPIFFLGFAFYTLFDKIERTNTKWYWYLLTGFIGALAIAGKQTFILLLIFPVYSLLTNKANFRNKVILILSMCSLPAYIYWIWGGIAPKSSSIKYNSLNIAYADFMNILFCLALISIVFYAYYIKEFIIAQLKKKLILSLFVIIIIAAVILFAYSNTPSVVALIRYTRGLMVDAFSITSAFFLYFCCRKVFKTSISLAVFVCLWCVILLKIPYFQGRYLALITPFILLLLLKANKIRLTPLTALVGYLFNLFSTLELYQFFHIRSAIKQLVKTIL